VGRERGWWGRLDPHTTPNIHACGILQPYREDDLQRKGLRGRKASPFRAGKESPLIFK